MSLPTRDKHVARRPLLAGHERQDIDEREQVEVEAGLQRGQVERLLPPRGRVDRLRDGAQRHPADRVPLPPDAASGAAATGRRTHAGEGEASKR